jgi:uncharacterized C2H2 Zn-finger protein
MVEEFNSEPEVGENERFKNVAGLRKTEIQESEEDDEEPKLFECERCDKTFARIKYLNRHVKVIHDQVRRTVSLKRSFVLFLA